MSRTPMINQYSLLQPIEWLVESYQKHTAETTSIICLSMFVLTVWAVKYANKVKSQKSRKTPTLNHHR